MRYFPERQLEKPTLRRGFLRWRVGHNRVVLLAYIDEIGETGAFVSRGHPRFNTSLSFGYAGFVVPAGNAREFGAIFQSEKKLLYRREIERAEHPGRWERKGSDVFRASTPAEFPAQLRVFDALVQHVRRLGGHLFYYADEKPVGTPPQTRGRFETDKHLYTDRETRAMREALNRIARHADHSDKNVMVMIDQVNEKDRSARVPIMYSHILGRAAEFPEMRRIIEPPMHVDSVLSANIQFADWVAACVTRAIDYQLLNDSPHKWITEPKTLPSVKACFTHDSKVHLWHRSVADLHQGEVFRSFRPLFPPVGGQTVASNVELSAIRRMKAAAERAHNR